MKLLRAAGLDPGQESEDDIDELVETALSFFRMGGRVSLDDMADLSSIERAALETAWKAVHDGPEASLSESDRVFAMLDAVEPMIGEEH